MNQMSDMLSLSTRWATLKCIPVRCRTLSFANLDDKLKLVGHG